MVTRSMPPHCRYDPMSAWSFLKVSFEIEHLVDHVAYCCSLSSAMWSKNNDGLNRALVLSASVDMQSGDVLRGMQLKVN